MFFETYSRVRVHARELGVLYWALLLLFGVLSVYSVFSAHMHLEMEEVSFGVATIRLRNPEDDGLDVEESEDSSGEGGVVWPYCSSAQCQARAGGDELGRAAAGRWPSGCISCYLSLPLSRAGVGRAGGDRACVQARHGGNVRAG